MPRRPRLRLPNFPFHVIQRGHNRAACFRSDSDRLCYLAELAEHARARRVAIHAYVLMTNHVHLLVTPHSPRGIERLMQRVGQKYARYFNRAYGRTGTVWDGRYRCSLVDTDEYLLTCQRYIEANPVRAGMVGDVSQYRWSSHRANAFGEPDALVTRHPLVESMTRASYVELFSHDLDERTLDAIRVAVNGGFVLGSEPFQKVIARVVKRRVGPGAGGRPRKPVSDTGFQGEGKLRKTGV